MSQTCDQRKEVVGDSYIMFKRIYQSPSPSSEVVDSIETKIVPAAISLDLLLHEFKRWCQGLGYGIETQMILTLEDPEEEDLESVDEVRGFYRVVKEDQKINCCEQANTELKPKYFTHLGLRVIWLSAGNHMFIKYCPFCGVEFQINQKEEN